MTMYEANRRELAYAVPYEGFCRAFEALLGRTDTSAAGSNAQLTPAEFRALFASYVGPLDFSLFQKLDHGAVLRGLGLGSTQATCYVFGNALIAAEMTRHDVRAGLYVPLRLLVRESAANGVLVTYDLPSALMAQFKCAEVDAVARSLDEKVQRLLDETIKQAAPLNASSPTGR
jgi:uncharacterized protein (DUF302 family)